MIRPMRSLCSLACLAACTFDAPKVGNGSGVDAQPPDTREPMWVMVEELTVPVTGATVRSKLALQAGVGYRLRASGTFYIALDTLGDAEYYDFNNGPPIDGASGTDVGIAVNDAIVNNTRTPRWGAYNEQHSYEVEWMGDGAPINVQLHDGNYGNNVGMLKLEIFALQ
jgi:hypothetical protein